MDAARRERLEEIAGRSGELTALGPEGVQRVPVAELAARYIADVDWLLTELRRAVRPIG